MTFDVSPVLARMAAVLVWSGAALLCIAGAATVMARIARSNARIQNFIWQAATVCAAAATIGIAIPWHTVVSANAGSVLHSMVIEAQAALTTTSSTVSRLGTGPSLAQSLAVIWLLGALGTALIAFRAACHTQRLRGVGALADKHDSAFQSLQRISQSLGIAVPELRFSRHIDVAVALDWRRPCILLPAECTEWLASERDVVLTHEAAHIAHFDLVARALADIVRIVHWYHPCALWLQVQLQRSAEFAADAEVMDAGVAATNYAEILVGFADRITGHSPALGLPFARRPQLAERVNRLLSRPIVGQGIQRRMHSFICITAFVVVLSLASVRVDARELSRHSDIVPAVTGPWLDDVIDGLVRTLQDESPHVRAAAARSLGRLGSARALPALRARLRDSSPSVRSDAVDAIVLIQRGTR